MDLEINGEPVEIQMQLDDEGDVSKQVTQLYYTCGDGECVNKSRRSGVY